MVAVGDIVVGACCRGGDEDEEEKEEERAVLSFGSCPFFSAPIEWYERWLSSPGQKTKPNKKTMIDCLPN